VRYQVYVPFELTREKEWPVILFLHGGGEGSPVNYTEYPEVGHNSWDLAFSDPMLWQWLFQQQRKVRSVP